MLFLRLNQATYWVIITQISYLFTFPLIADRLWLLLKIRAVVLEGGLTIFPVPFSQWKWPVIITPDSMAVRAQACRCKHTCSCFCHWENDTSCHTKPLVYLMWSYSQSFIVIALIYNVKNRKGRNSKSSN